MFPVWLLLGPRQVGKSSLFQHQAQHDPSRQFITFDDIATRSRATQDPVLFMKGLKPPICFDEIQYAPQILSQIKLWVDRDPATAGQVWMTGSQNFEVMKGVQESLAGRVAIMNLFGLTDSEKNSEISTPEFFFQQALNSNFPKLAPVENQPGRDLYISNYIQTYVERDVRELLGIQKRRQFEVFLKLCAHRTGQLVNYEDLGRDAGVSASTAKEWLTVLEDSFLIKIVLPWFSNRSKRLIKTPKLYFLDVGIACYLMGFANEEQARLSPAGGALFETAIVSNIYRSLKHNLKTFEIFFWRDKDQHEVDLLVELEGKIFPLEIKMGQPRVSRLLNFEKLNFPNVQKGQVISLVAEKNPVALNSHWDLVSPHWITKFLVGF